MQKTISVKGFKPSEDGKTTFIYDMDGGMAIFRGSCALEVGKEITVEGENKTSKAGKPYFNITSINKDTSKPEPQVTPKPETKIVHSEPADRNVQGLSVCFALSYAKDLAVAGLLPKENILTWAEYFKGYLNGDGGDDAKVIKALSGDKK